jgi:competence protein ComEA
MVALSGSLVRLARARGSKPAVAQVDAGLQRQLTRVDSARERRASAKQGRPAARPSAERKPPAEPVDLNRASAQEIEALPGIGPALAARIVAFRDSAGAFGSAEQLCRVKGIGPALIQRIGAKVVFSGVTAERDACKVAAARTSKSHVTNRRKPR